MEHFGKIFAPTERFAVQWEDKDSITYILKGIKDNLHFLDYIYLLSRSNVSQFQGWVWARAKYITEEKQCNEYVSCLELENSQTMCCLQVKKIKK